MERWLARDPLGLAAARLLELGLRDGPLDHETVLGSVAKTNRPRVVEEGTRVGGWGANLLGIVTAEALDELDDAWIVATEDTPAPYSPTLEDAWLPGAGVIAAAVPERLGVTGASSSS